MYAIRSYYGNIGYLPQEIFISSGTFLENLNLGLSSDEKDKCIEVCRRVKLEEKVNSWPERYETLLRERGAVP